MVNFLKVFFLFFIVQVAYSQSEFAVKWVNTDINLNQSTAKSFTLDNDGFIWIGTELGLFRYDGLSLTQFKGQHNELNNQSIGIVALDPLTGNLIVKTSIDNFVYEIKQNQIIKKSKKNDSKYIFLRDTVLTDNNKFIQPVLKDPNFRSHYQEFSSYSNFDPIRISDFIYIFTNNKTLVFNINGFFKSYPNKDLLSQRVAKIFDEVWILGGKKKVYSRGIETKSNYLTDDILTSAITDIRKNEVDIKFFHDKKYTYLCYNQNIYLLKKNKNYIYCEFLFEIQDSNVTNIAYYESNDFYLVGTSTKGLAIYYPKKLNTIFFKNSFQNPNVNENYAVSTIADNEIVSASGWKYNFETKSKERLSFSPQLFKWYLFKFNNGLYGSVNNKMLNIFNGKQLDVQIFDTNKLYFSYCDCNVIKWINQDRSIVKLLKGKIYEIPKLRNFFPENSVKYIICNKQNEIVIATDKGVFIYNEKLNIIKDIKPLRNVNSRFLKKEGDGFWIGTFGEGLFYFEQNILYHVKDKTHPLKSVHSIETDHERNLWLSSNEGLFYVNRLKALKSIKQNKPIESVIFTTEDGLLINEFNGGCFPTSIKTKEGILGFPSMKGYVWFDPKKVNLNPFNYNIQIDKVLVNDIEYKVYKNIVSVNKNQNKVEVFYSFPYYFNRKNLCVEYKLSSDNQWKKLKSNRIIIVRHKKGKQKLLIRVHSNGFNSNYDKHKELIINFEPKFYETNLFLVVIFFGLVMLIFLTAKVVNYFNYKKRKQLELLVNQKTEEIELNRQELIVLNYDLEKTLKIKETLMHEIHHRVKNHLQFLMSMLGIQSRVKTNSVEEFVQITNDRLAAIAAIHEQLYEKHESKELDLALVLGQLAKSLAKIKNNQLNISVKSNQRVVIATHLCVSVALIVNELISNSIKHNALNSNQTISIDLEVNDNYLTIRYIDHSNFNYQLISTQPISGTKILLILLEQLYAKINHHTGIGKFEFYFSLV